MKKNTSRIQIKYTECQSIERKDRTIIDTYDPELARTLTEELIDQVINNVVYNDHTYQIIDVDCGRHGTHSISLVYNDKSDDVNMFVDGFVIMPYELDYKLIDMFE